MVAYCKTLAHKNARDNFITTIRILQLIMHNGIVLTGE